MFRRFFLVLIIFLFFGIGIFSLIHKQKKNEFIFWTIQLKPVATEFIEKNIDEFKNRHEGVDVVWIDIPIAEAQKRILASILGGNPPDLVNLNPDFSVILAQIGALDFFSEEEASAFDKNVINALKYDGNIYGIPFYATSAVTVVNKNCIEDYSHLKKYDDILNVKNKCSNSFGINLNENDTLAKILNKYNVFDFDSEDDIKNTRFVFDTFKNMYDKGLIPKDSLTVNHREVVEKYMAGGTGAVVVGGNFVKMIEENARDVYENSVILPQLTGANGKYDISLMNFVIPKKAKNKELAHEFLFQITNTENQVEFGKLTNVLVPNTEALKDDFYNPKDEKDLKDVARKVGVYQMKNLLGKNFGYKNKKEINDTINEALEEYILNGTLDLKSLSENVRLLQNKE